MPRYKKSVLFLESSPNIGGQELQLLQQMRELKAIGYHVRLLCKPGSRIRAFAEQNLIEHSEVRFRNALDLGSIISVRRHITELEPLAIVLHSGHDAIVGALAARLVKHRPTIIRMRTYLAGKPSTIPYQYLFDITLACSAFLREEILENKQISPKKIKILYPGIDFNKQKQNLENATIPTPIKNWLDKHPGPVILHGAMLRPEKGHQTILRALPEIINAHPNVRYIIAGEGRLRTELETTVRINNLENNVLFTGLVNPIHSLFQVADIAILPSMYEPLGMFQIESIGSLIPTIASNIGGIPETVAHRETGLLLKAGGVEEWAQGIIWALNNIDQMKTWAEKGQLINENKFSIKENIRTLESYILQRGLIK